MVVGCCSDGTIKCYETRNYYGRPTIQINSTHVPEAQVTKIVAFNDGNRLVTRCMDHSMKIWDIRNTKAAIHSIYNLENNHAGARICISPDEKYILTGTSCKREES